MARRVDRARKLSPRRGRPVAGEFSAGGLVYRRRAGECRVVLAARRHPESGTLVWMLPKGHLEPGETPAEAARREVREETGLDAEVERPLGDVTYWYVRRNAREGPRRVLKRVRFFVMRHRGGRFRDRDDEMDAVRWFSLATAETRATRLNERRLLRRARRLLEGDGRRTDRSASRGRTS